MKNIIISILNIIFVIAILTTLMCIVIYSDDDSILWLISIMTISTSIGLSLIGILFGSIGYLVDESKKEKKNNGK